MCGSFKITINIVARFIEFGGFPVTIDFKKVWHIIKDKKNVVGYSRSLKKRIKNGATVNGGLIIRVYVSKKEPLEAIDPDDVIPKTIDGIETDVVEIGEIKAQRD